MSDTPTPSPRLVQTWKRVQNMQAVGLAEGAYVGRLEDFQFDLETHQVYGWRLKGTGYFGRTGGVAARHLTMLGRDVALLDSEASVEWSTTGRNNPGGRAWASTYRGTQAITRRGLALGAVQDFVLAADGSRVTGVILHGERLLALDQRVHLGPSAVIAAEESALVELGDGDGEPEGPTWWARLKDALAARSVDGRGAEPRVGEGSPGEGRSAELRPAEQRPSERRPAEVQGVVADEPDTDER